MNTPPCIEFWQGGVFLCLKRRILHRCFGSGFWQALLGSWHRPAACWGIAQGLWFAALLFVLALPSGVFTESAAWMRFAAVILCGSLGGFLGVRSHPKKHLG